MCFRFAGGSVAELGGASCITKSCLIDMQIYRSDKAISDAGEGLDETRRVRRVAQRVPKPLHSGINAVFEIDVSAFGPESFLQVFSSDHLARTLEQHSENTDWLSAELDWKTVFSQLSSFGTELERAEPKNAARRARFCLDNRARHLFDLRVYTLPYNFTTRQNSKLFRRIACHLRFAFRALQFAAGSSMLFARTTPKSISAKERTNQMNATK